MKTYVITLSKRFPKGHVLHSRDTNFKLKFHHGIKNHTIRNNYELWYKRFKKIRKREATIEIREWSGLPYRSKQTLIQRLDPLYLDLQKVQIETDNFNSLFCIDDNDFFIENSNLINNDGLSRSEFISWFKDVSPTKELALIHFDGKRYQFGQKYKSNYIL